MKKLKLYGEKKGFLGIKRKGFVAEIFVKDGKVVVESKKKSIKKEIERQIDFWLNSEHGGPLLPQHKIGKDKSGRRYHVAVEIPKKPTDPDFLMAILAVLSEQEIAGYKIGFLIFSKSKIIEE